MREFGRHSVYALAGAQSEVLVRLLMARLMCSTLMIHKRSISPNLLSLNIKHQFGKCWQHYSTERKCDPHYAHFHTTPATFACFPV